MSGARKRIRYASRKTTDLEIKELRERLPREPRGYKSQCRDVRGDRPRVGDLRVQDGSRGARAWRATQSAQAHLDSEWRDAALTSSTSDGNCGFRSVVEPLE